MSVLSRVFAPAAESELAAGCCNDATGSGSKASQANGLTPITVVDVAPQTIPHWGCANGPLWSLAWRSPSSRPTARAASTTC
ncbi:hypothetical protein Actkin_01134 [Actinokineospora sp. UTMC 2448]|nr:hypothetical protein Actkin_01134 [Actinokineospora sp. UTMC 2448]